MNPLTLVDYLHGKYPELTNKIVVANDASEYQAILYTLNIIESRNLSSLVIPEKDGTYIDLIDDVVDYLVQKNSNNVLRSGYNGFSGDVTSKNVSFQVNHLKSRHWKTLYCRIGHHRMVDLILNTRCFVQNTRGVFVQLFGPSLSPSTPPRPIVLSKTKQLYKYGGLRSNNLKLLPDNEMQLLQEIYAKQKLNLKSHVPEKYRNLCKLLVLMIQKDERVKYHSIFHKLIPEPRKYLRKNYLQLSCAIQYVIKFVLVIIGKVFPLATWGTKQNKSIIIDKIVSFIKSGRYARITMDKVLEGIKVSEINWLGKTKEISSKQDYQSRISIFSVFMKWLFEIFVGKLIAKFFYVCETTQFSESATSGLFYYTHRTWNGISREWLQAYINSNLTDVTDKESNADIEKFERFNFGELRLIPKKNDFRVLCVPIKKPCPPANGTFLTQQDFELQRKQYQSHHFNNVMPLLQLISDKNRKLLELKEKAHARCYSMIDISAQISKFKHRLLSKNNNKLPQLFMIKFDMKHCYDQLNQGKIMQCFQRLFDADDDDSAYYIRRIEEYHDFQQLSKKLRALIKDHTCIEELNILDSSNSVSYTNNKHILVDKNITRRLTKSQILDIIRGQVLHSTMKIGDKLYQRKQGVFQGFPLLATFCDMVYNSLVDDLFDFLLQSPIDSLLLRLVDDFLFISTDKAQCKLVYDILNGEIAQEYGAFMNTEKSSWINFDSSTNPELVKFVGLTIDSGKLEITRGLESSAPISLASKLSFKSVFKMLQDSYSLRLKPSLLDLNLVSDHSLVFNYSVILNSVMEAFTMNFKRLNHCDKFEPDLFKVFLMELLNISLERYYSANCCIIHFNLMTDEFKKCTIFNLQKKNRMFDPVIEWLKDLKI